MSAENSSVRYTSAVRTEEFMRDHSPGYDQSATYAVPHIKISIPDRATPEEIARRRDLFRSTISLREEIGSIGIDPVELIHQLRDETDEPNG